MFAFLPLDLSGQRGIGVACVCLYVHLSVHPSVCLSVNPLTLTLSAWLLITNLSWNNEMCTNMHPGPWFNIKMSSYQYRKFNCGDKMILRPSYLQNGISYTGKMTSLYWIGALGARITIFHIVNFGATPLQLSPSTKSVDYNDVIMGAIASQITSLAIVYSTVYSGADQRKHQSSASLAFVQGIHRGPMNSLDKWPVTQKMFPFDDVIMWYPQDCTVVMHF